VNTFAALERGNPVHLPAAQNVIHSSRRAAEETPSLADGQLVDVAGHQPMREIIVGLSALGAPVGGSSEAWCCKASLPCDVKEPSSIAFEKL